MASPAFPMYPPDSDGGVRAFGRAAGMRRDGRLRVLLIEDDAVLGEAVRDYVAGLGHAVDWMQTLEDGRTATAAVGYELILLDLRLPDGSGLTLLKDLRRAGAAVGPFSPVNGREKERLAAAPSFFSLPHSGSEGAQAMPTALPGK